MKFNISKSDKDVFLADKLKNANFNTGFYQIPFIKEEEIEKPNDLILRSNRNQCKNKSECGLVFYEYDCRFDGRNGIYSTLKYGTEKQINKLINSIKDFAFVVCPDYSLYGNFPNYKQIDALSRSREVGYILSTYGIKVVINYRALYNWSYELSLSGIAKYQTVAIGTLGALRDKNTRLMLTKSVEALVSTIEPKTIIVYGKAPKDVFKSALDKNLEIWQFDSKICRAHMENH